MQEADSVARRQTSDKPPLHSHGAYIHTSNGIQSGAHGSEYGVDAGAV